VLPCCSARSARCCVVRAATARGSRVRDCSPRESRELTQELLSGDAPISGDAHGDLGPLALCAPEAADQGVSKGLRPPGDLSQQQGDEIAGFVVQTAQVHGWCLSV